MEVKKSSRGMSSRAVTITECIRQYADPALQLKVETAPDIWETWFNSPEHRIHQMNRDANSTNDTKDTEAGFPAANQMQDFIYEAAILPTLPQYMASNVHEYRRMYVCAAMRFVAGLLTVEYTKGRAGQTTSSGSGNDSGSASSSGSKKVPTHLDTQLQICQAVQQQLESYKQVKTAPYGLTPHVWKKILLLSRLVFVSTYACRYMPDMKAIVNNPLALPSAFLMSEFCGFHAPKDFKNHATRLQLAIELCTTPRAELEPQYRFASDFLTGILSVGVRPLSGQWFVLPSPQTLQTTNEVLGDNADGDDVAFKLDGVTYHGRLNEVDTYELHGNATSKDETDFCMKWARTARDSLHEWMKRAKTLQLKVTGLQPGYNNNQGYRVLLDASLFNSTKSDGYSESINLKMITQGLGRAYPTRNVPTNMRWKPHIITRMETHIARKERTGLWCNISEGDDPPCMPEEQRKNGTSEPWLVIPK